MASPYLLIGAFPELMRFLPKPGVWMDTFKQIMGFVLLGTVVFVLTFIPWAYVVPTVGLLFGLWGACWWIGRIPVTAPAGVPRFEAGLGALAFAGLVWIVTFPGLGDVMQSRFEESVASAIEGPWQPFTSLGFSREAIESRKTVLIDFTANWCLTCKTLEAQVLNTQPVLDAAEAAGIVMLKADWTRPRPGGHGDARSTGQQAGANHCHLSGRQPKPARPYSRGGYTQGLPARCVRGRRSFANAVGHGAPNL